MGARVVKQVFYTGLFALLVVIIAVVVRTVSLKPRTITGPECSPDESGFIRADDKMIGRFQKALRMETISWEPGVYNVEELLKIQQFIKDSYPTVHTSPLVTVEVVANYSLLYTVHGSDRSLKPYMLIGHLDVVPVPDEEWDAPPFSGQIKDEFIYGRGTIDDKHIVFGILEALEFLLQRDYKPERTFYIGFGHDEEVSGEQGAFHIGELLKSRGVQVEFLLDEGPGVISGVVPGVDKPVALVGCSEKGYITLKLEVTASGGHSSLPERESSIGILANAVARLEANPHPSSFGTGPEKGMFEHLAPEMTLPLRVVMSNLWLFQSLVSRVLSWKPATNALIRTTTAVTQFNAGIKVNVIAPHAEAIVNHRIHPSETIQEVIDFDKKVINDDRVNITILQSQEPLPVSSYDDEVFGWQTIKTSILQVWGHYGSVVVPGLMPANTDTRHYVRIAKNIYRFSPSFMYAEDLARFHGRNERISKKNYEEAVNFYYHIIKNADKAMLKPMHKHGEEL